MYVVVVVVVVVDCGSVTRTKVHVRTLRQSRGWLPGLLTEVPLLQMRGYVSRLMPDIPAANVRAFQVRVRSGDTRGIHLVIPHSCKQLTCGSDHFLVVLLVLRPFFPANCSSDGHRKLPLSFDAGSEDL